MKSVTVIVKSWITHVTLNLLLSRLMVTCVALMLLRSHRLSRTSCHVFCHSRGAESVSVAFWVTHVASARLLPCKDHVNLLSEFGTTILAIMM
ncbi:hypothetical protein RRG08_010174 [Elysia crispata]|uniref:Uncharacterized protein n=1 Tax=Elysia crispata TaxID=231223 RepID=A0AAE1E0C9_9GAST|nr:hypothetical protein RRG08_010174 [Elysia crispata]